MYPRKNRCPNVFDPQRRIQGKGSDQTTMVPVSANLYQQTRLTIVAISLGETRPF